MIEQTWGRNLYQLSTEERKQLEDHVSDFRYIVMLCRVGSQGIRDGVAYGSDKEHGIEFYPDQFFAEVEAFAKGFPPSDGLESYKRFDFSAERRIEDEPFYFRTFGLGVDGVDHVAYFDFLHCFSVWYAANRNFLTLATGDTHCKTWEQIDALVKKNPRSKSWPLPKPARTATADVDVNYDVRL